MGGFTTPRTWKPISFIPRALRLWLRRHPTMPRGCLRLLSETTALWCSWSTKKPIGWSGGGPRGRVCPPHQGIGDDVTVVTYGLMLHYSLEAAGILADEGVSVEVIDLRTLKPLDTDSIVNSVKKTGRALIVHEDNITGGVGAEVAAVLAGEAFEYLDSPVMRVCGPDIPTMPFAPTLEDAYMPSTEKIAAALRKLAAY